MVEKEGAEYRRLQRPLGTVVIPEFELKKTRPVRIPTLVVHGDHSVRTSLPDAQAVAKHFGGSVARFAKSARVPFIEEHDKFVKLARKFLKKR